MAEKKLSVRLPLMIQDPMTAPESAAAPKASKRKNEDTRTLVEGIIVSAEPNFRDFLDGPVTPKIAILDFDPKSGLLIKGARFQYPSKGKKRGTYEFDEDDIYSDAFIQSSVLAAVLKTLRLFEDEEVLGRSVAWAFGAEQIFVVPRAGEWENAFYERDSHSLQFFYFKNPHDPQKVVYTALSRDIVAHETGHAIIDGIAPTLYDALTLESLALHEAMADLTAVMTAFGSNALTHRVLDQTGGSIREPTAFSSLASEFGTALSQTGGANALRSMWNDANLASVEAEPHALSLVLSGGMYRLMNFLYETIWGKFNNEYSKSGYSLAVAAKLFQRFAFRALDFLPPGNVSFLDYARAVYAAERSATGTTGVELSFLADELQRRGVLGNVKDIEVAIPTWKLDVDTRALYDSESEAYAFVARNRAQLNVPPDVPFVIAGRYHTRKNSPRSKDENRLKEELIFKISWEQIENDQFSPSYPATRRVMAGTTLVTDWNSGTIEAVLTSDLQLQKRARDAMVRSLWQRGLLPPPNELRFEKSLLFGAPRVSVVGGHLHIHGLARLLHMRRGEE